jgi:hypothetical protein
MGTGMNRRGLEGWGSSIGRRAGVRVRRRGAVKRQFARHGMSGLAHGQGRRNGSRWGGGGVGHGDVTRAGGADGGEGRGGGIRLRMGRRRRAMMRRVRSLMLIGTEHGWEVVAHFHDGTHSSSRRVMSRRRLGAGQIGTWRMEKDDGQEARCERMRWLLTTKMDREEFDGWGRRRAE